MKLVREHINRFERGQSPKQAMDIGYEKWAREEVASCIGKMSPIEVYIGLEAMCDDPRIGGAYKDYLSKENKEKIYIIYSKLGPQAIMVQTFFMPDYMIDGQLRDSNVSKLFARDAIYDQLEDFRKEGWEIFHTEEIGDNLEVILINYSNLKAPNI